MTSENRSPPSKCREIDNTQATPLIMTCKISGGEKARKREKTEEREQAEGREDKQKLRTYGLFLIEVRKRNGNEREGGRK